MLLGISSSMLQSYMDCIAQVGQSYGLRFNWSKLERMDVLCNNPIFRADGMEITSKESLTYLGSLILNNSRITSELSRRVGLAASEFKALKQCWNHIDLLVKEKLAWFSLQMLASDSWNSSIFSIAYQQLGDSKTSRSFNFIAKN